MELWALQQRVRGAEPSKRFVVPTVPQGNVPANNTKSAVAGAVLGMLQGMMQKDAEDPGDTPMTDSVYANTERL